MIEGFNNKIEGEGKTNGFVLDLSTVKSKRRSSPHIRRYGMH